MNTPLRSYIVVLAASLAIGCESGQAPSAGPVAFDTLVAGWLSTCGLDDGTPYCWGGELGGFVEIFDSVPRPLPGSLTFKRLAMPDGPFGNYACGVASGDSLLCWGTMLVDVHFGISVGEDPTALPFATPLGGLDAGPGHFCALPVNGSLSCWGDYDAGRRGQGETPPDGWDLVPNSVASAENLLAVATGDYHTCALTQSGHPLCWGRPDLVGVMNPPVETTYDDCRITSPCVWAPVMVDSVNTYSVIAAGSAHTCAIATGGTVWCWGSNYAGGLGPGAVDSSLTPVTVALPEPAASLALGMGHSCAVTTSGRAYCWGLGLEGQLGNGGRSNTNTPSLVFGNLRFRQMTAGGQHTCGITVGGTAYCWGDNDLGQVGFGTLQDVLEPVKVVVSTGS